MATSSTIPSSLSLSIFLLFLSLQLTPLAFATFASSSVATDQTDFWSKNVVNSMPEAVVSKLSPLSNQDFVSLASSISKPSVYSEYQFCSMANLACAALKDERTQLAQGYNGGDLTSKQVTPGYNGGYLTSKQVTTGYNGGYLTSKQVTPGYSGGYLTSKLVTPGYNGGYLTPKRTAHMSDEVDPNLFFRISILKNGNKAQLPNLNDQFPHRTFLPSIIASKISTTSAPDLQKFFPNSSNSVSIKETMERSISYCSSPRMKGEIKSCPNSLEDMIEFSKKTLGVKKIMSLTSESTKGSKKVLKIANIDQFRAQKVVTCHEVFFPFATYLCHFLSSSFRIYAVDFVEPTTKAPVNKVVAVCHMDTSAWPADHVAFKILKLSPGRGELCHWLRKADLAWIGNGEKKS